MGLSPFAILVLEHDPLQWSELPNMLVTWAQHFGGFALVALAIYLGYHLIPGFASPAEAEGKRSTLLIIAATLFVLSLASFGVGRGIQFVEWMHAPPPDPNSLREEFARTDKLPTAAPKPDAGAGLWADYLMTLGGALAIIGFAMPFGRDLFRLRARRIGAIARLSFKEAVRRRVVWAPVVLLLVFLFPPKWFFRIKPEDEVSTYVSVIYWAMTPVMLLIASLLAAFAIPTDIRNQTIHTVVTKPVERFEIVLGRALGYISLATVILGVLSIVSLLLLWASDPSEEAKYESYKARVPVFGKLEFKNARTPNVEFKGESVGREWEYRSYIAGASPHRAVFVFSDESALRDLAARPDAVPCEFSFDIFRTTKGDENKGVTCTFEFVAWPWGDPYKRDAQREQAYQDAKRGVKEFAQPDDPAQKQDWDKLEEVAEKFGYYKYPSKEIVDYHTFDIKVPRSLIKAALTDPKSGTKLDQPRLMVVVKCESPTQFLGVAKGDLYLLAGDQPFWLNFLKGVLGLWLRLVLVISIAVACSTYLSGVIGWLIVWILFVFGMFQEFIAKLAAGTSVGGGPAESFVRLAQNSNITAPLPDSAGKSLALTFDTGFQWVLRRVMDILPDVDSFSWSHYVASGFSVPTAEIVINTLVLVGYLLPWAILAYYLMKSREVAA
jgi:ABC-type transport system involved in multi-copper enzyme maturation permease subunit